MPGKPRRDELAFHFSPPDVDRSWMQRGRCWQYARRSGPDGLPDPMSQAWFVMSPNEKRVVDGHLYSGRKLIEFALLNCEVCPAQWDCARFAVTVNEQGGTWSMPIGDLRWLIRSKRAIEVIDAAEAAEVSMQRAVAAIRNHDKVSVCPPSPPPSSTTTHPSLTTSSAARSTGRRHRRESRSTSGEMISAAS